ncbi:MFS transporter permease [Longispora sp. NPDC051575]|uniref:MFS transporter permease n=1 Tax=Longispora sp. NPDC051575 TaxID=3154943 RepID=UPI0034448B43
MGTVTATPVPTQVPGWLCAPVPLGRVALFRVLAYLFVAADLVVFTPWVRGHATVPVELYRPVLVARILHLPAPTPALVHGVFWALLAVALVAASGRWPRVLGGAVFLLYAEWMVVAMSYGKVDHDRFGLLVALAALPTVGRARFGSAEPSAAGGWALRVTQLAVVATYFLAGWAKLRFGGIEWLTGATMTRAVLRRGTWLGQLVLGVPGLLVLSQFGIMAFELASPVVLFVRERARYLLVGGFYLFHAVVFATVTITFLPHQVAMASFLPLERAVSRLLGCPTDSRR